MFFKLWEGDAMKITGKQLADAAVAAIPMGITYQQISNDTND